MSSFVVLIFITYAFFILKIDGILGNSGNGDGEKVKRLPFITTSSSNIKCIFLE